MPRAAAGQSIDEILRAAVEAVVGRATGAIQKAVAARVSTELARVPAARRRAGAAPGRRRRRAVRGELTRWVADNRARRVPNFVIDATGLDTKKKIVARYGANAAFEKGKPPPSPRGDARKAAGSAGAPRAQRTVKARAPIVRKAAAKSRGAAAAARA